jgi:hypothetical protein
MVHALRRGSQLFSSHDKIFSKGLPPMITRYFREHPQSVGESYVGHAKQANRIGWVMIAGGLACLIHAVFPFLYPRTASKMIRYLSLVARKRKPRRAETRLAPGRAVREASPQDLRRTA